MFTICYSFRHQSLQIPPMSLFVSVCLIWASLSTPENGKSLSYRSFNCNPPVLNCTPVALVLFNGEYTFCNSPVELWVL